MKKLAYSIAAIAVAAVTSGTASRAQSASVLKPIRLGVSLGSAIPLGDFASAVQTGYNATGTLALQPVGLPIGFSIDAAFNRFGIKGGGGNANVFVVSGNVVLPFAAAPGLAPYIIGGVGYYHESVNSTVAFPQSVSTSANRSENHPGFNVGAGINIPLTGFDTFIEARYHRVSENGGSTSFIPITVGVLF